MAILTLASSATRVQKLSSQGLYLHHFLGTCLQCLSLYSFLQPEPLNLEPFSPQGICANFWRHFCWLQLVEWCYWHLVGFGQGCHLNILWYVGQSPTKKNDLAQNVHNTEAEKPCRMHFRWIMPHTELPLEHLPYGMPPCSVIASVPLLGWKLIDALCFIHLPCQGIWNTNIQQHCELMECVTIVCVISPERN